MQIQSEINQLKANLETRQKVYEVNKELVTKNCE